MPLPIVVAGCPPTTAVISAFVSLLLLLTGCSTTSKVDQSSSANIQAVWPAPPEQARIRFVSSIKSRADIEGHQSPSLRDRLLGEAPDDDLLFEKPYGVHSDSNGLIFVTDSGSYGITVLDRNNKSVSQIGQSGKGTIIDARGITTDASGNIYVSDIGHQRVVAFNKNGDYITAFGGSEVLRAPAGLAYSDKNQLLYVVDVQLHQVLAFNSQGEVEFTIGGKGHEEGKFNYPTNISLDPSQQQLFISDTLNFRVQVFKTDGHFVRAFGKNGNRPGNFSRLKGIGIDNQGHVYAVDAAFNNFQIFNPQGELLLAVGRASLENDGFYLPAGAFVDKNNQIFVADQLNRRVQIFEYLAETE